MTTARSRALRGLLPVLAALGMAALVSGCVAYPDYGYYDPGYGYGYGYTPGPYVAVGGGWGWGDHDWHDHDWHEHGGHDWHH